MVKMSKILWLFKMSGTSIEQTVCDAVIDPTASNITLPTMPLNGCVRGKNTTINLEEFMRNILHFVPCCRVYNEETRELKLVYYNQTYLGCQVIMKLKRAVITIERFLHGDVLENVDHTFDSSGFQRYVTPFLTHAELEKQKRFDNLQVEQKKLMAEQQKLQKQEEERQKKDLLEAHVSKPQTCGGVDKKCTYCIHNQANKILTGLWKSNFTPSGT